MTGVRSIGTAGTCLLIGLLGSAAMTPTAAAQVPAEATLTVDVSPRQARVGDVVEARLTLEIPDELARGLDGEPVFPNWQQHWGDAEIRSVTGVDRSSSSDGGVRYVQKLSLTSFRPGNVTLPDAVVELPQSPGAEPRPISVAGSAGFEVVSVLPQSQQDGLEPKPPEPPRALPVGRAFWWTAVVFAALAVGLIAVLVARRPGHETYSGATVDPWTALEQALAKLAGTVDPETVFTGLSLELRRYLGRSLSFPAAESTTTELRRRLLRSGLPSNVCGDVVRLLLEADTVKFARRTPQASRVAQCLEEVLSAAGAVRVFLQPESPEGAEERVA